MLWGSRKCICTLVPGVAIHAPLHIHPCYGAITQPILKWHAAVALSSEPLIIFGRCHSSDQMGPCKRPLPTEVELLEKYKRCFAATARCWMRSIGTYRNGLLLLVCLYTMLSILQLTSVAVFPTLVCLFSAMCRNATDQQELATAQPGYVPLIAVGLHILI